MSTSLVNLIDFSLRLVDDAQSENAHSCIFAEVDFHIRAIRAVYGVANRFYLSPRLLSCPSPRHSLRLLGEGHECELLCDRDFPLRGNVPHNKFTVPTTISAFRPQRGTLLGRHKVLTYSNSSLQLPFTVLYFDYAKQIIP